MPSPLVQFAYQLNQHINDCIYPYCIKWNDSEGKWKSENDWKRLVPYYLLHMVYMDVIAPMLVVSTFYTILFIPSVLPFEKKIIFTIFAAVLPFSTFVDYFFYHYRAEVLMIVNWVIEELDKPCGKGTVSRTIQRKSHVFRTFIQEIGNLIHGKHCDWVGLFLCSFVTGLTTISLIFAPLLVYAECDPFSLILIILSSPETFGWTFPAQFPLMKNVILMGVCFLTGLVTVVVNIKTFSVLGMSFLFGYLKLLQRIQAFDLNFASVQRYKELYIAENMIREPLQIVTALILEVSFLAVVVGTTVAVTWGKMGNFIISGVGIFFSVSGTMVAAIMFVTGCSWYIISGSIFDSWRREIVGVCRNRALMRRKIRSCRRLALSAGGVRILDDTVKNSFCYATVTYTANLLLATSSVLK
ncbi:unnamed protein product [Orchesella dallaii]|uniref:Odorant receptor n=1 Tax=Orchesella dallaii TaxID=48710 RepID=A0ABP1RGN1_9HEXA